jgi:hypothetical protein
MLNYRRVPNFEIERQQIVLNFASLVKDLQQFGIGGDTLRMEHSQSIAISK